MILTESINFIEMNLCEPISRQDIAAHCYVSLSTLEKVFRYALNMGIKGYISRRRITQATKDISKAGMSITETAMKYQFNSVEVFSRMFKRVWKMNPSEFAKTKRKFTGLYPKLNLNEYEYEYEEGEDSEMARKKRVDISEAYDFLRSMKNSYVLCFDIQHLMPINDRYSVKAGDLAILEMAARIDSAAGDDMIVMRIGGDEFALLTGLYEYDEAKKLSEKVLAKNAAPFMYEAQEIPLSLWCGITKIPENLRYSEFFTDMHESIKASKK
jgi:AraC family transcriptional regulator